MKWYRIKGILGYANWPIRSRLSPQSSGTPAIDCKVMTRVAQAMRLMKRLEGTVIADLRSLLEWARAFDDRHGPQTQLGGFNFTLALLSLVACEVYGFYLTGAKKHRSIASPAQADTGYYTMEFIQRYFPN